MCGSFLEMFSTLAEPFLDITTNKLNNRPFPSSIKSHFQSEAKCEAIDMKMSFNYDANKTHFHNKGFALSLVLKVRFFGTRKWPIMARSAFLPLYLLLEGNRWETETWSCSISTPTSSPAFITSSFVSSPSKTGIRLIARHSLLEYCSNSLHAIISFLIWVNQVYLL